MVGYIAGFDEKVFLNPREKRYVDELARQERINPLTDENIFKSGLYIILAIKEQYKKQFSIYNKLRKQGLDTPQTILDNTSEVRNIVSSSMKTKKPAYIIGFAEWWMDSDWKNRLMEDVKDGRKNWYALRGELADNAPGMSYKSASFIMEASGYGYPVVIDTWVLKYLVYKDLIDESCVTLNHGLSKGQYLPIERIMTALAIFNNVMPTTFRRSLWVKNSTWKKTKGSLDQIVLPFDC